MKRALLVLLLLAVAGGLFAQISWSGGVLGGIEVAYEDDAMLYAYHHDSSASGYRFELTGAYTNDDKNAGINARIRHNGSFDGQYAFVWLKPLDILTLYGGRIDANNYGTFGGFDANGGVISPTGVALRLDPIPGLSIGAGVNPTGGEVGDASYRFGARYTAAGLVDVAANLQYNGAGNNGDGETNVNAGFNVLALSGLGFSRLAVDVQANNLSDLTWIGVGPRIEFSAAGINLGLRSQVYIPLEDQDLDASAAVWVSYPIGSVTPRLGAAYALKGALSGDPGAAFDARDWDGVPKGISAEDTSVVIVRPSVSFGIGGGSIEAGYTLQTELSGDRTRHGIFAFFSRGF